MQKVDLEKLDTAYFALVVEAAYGLRRDGIVDIETAAQADELGYSVSTLTSDAEAYRRQNLTER